MPKTLTLCAALIIAAITVIAAPPALAVTTTTLIITDDGRPVPRTSIHIIDTATGTEIARGSGSNSDCRFVLDLAEGTYKILAGSAPVGQFSVTGEGEETVAYNGTRRVFVSIKDGCFTITTPNGEGGGDRNNGQGDNGSGSGSNPD